ncbi:MAG: nickel pincer cofactor biosynthesis protein LarC [Cyanobacteriota bacterium]|nr:nickel pincer cofactor biosynthesis protein LarC [Cyanobacteriota bacterium]
MTKLAYLECPTGIAGDMCLGALVHSGVPLEYLVEQLDRLKISREYRLRSELVARNQQQATKVYVDLIADGSDNDSASDESADAAHERSHHHHHHHHHPAVRHLPDIEALIKGADLPDRARDWSLAVFRTLARAEGAVHGIAPEKVHFHEVGATDAIVDVVGTCLGLDYLGIDRLYCSALPTGGGTIRAAHGLLPVPAPAVLKLWEMREVPIYSNGIDRELVTPTGAAIAVTLAKSFGAPPPMRLKKVGLGAGSRDFALPNILRLWIGEDGEKKDGRGDAEMGGRGDEEEKGQGETHSHRTEDTEIETIALLETQIDDASPQAIGYTFDALFEVGALDVFAQPIGMKKCRPGVLLSVVCHRDRVAACEAVMFRETTTLGIRRSFQERSILAREVQTVSIPYGEVRVKVASYRNGAIANVHPEYEDCAQLAKQNNASWQEIHRLTLQSWHDINRGRSSASHTQ